MCPDTDKAVLVLLLLVAVVGQVMVMVLLEMVAHQVMLLLLIQAVVEQVAVIMVHTLAELADPVTVLSPG
jgi:hypothetical protein